MDIFEYNKRQEMKQHPLFQQINYKPSSENVGNTSYILRQAHENATRDNPMAVVKIGDWIKYYFASGEQRKELGQENYQTIQYYGRTEEEIAVMAASLHYDLIQKGYKITLQAAENIVYISVIDDPYSEYVRCCNIMFKMRKQYPNMKFFLSKPQEMKEYGVDIMAYKDGKLVGAIKTLPRTALGKKERLDEFKQMHDTFKMIYGCNIQFTFSSVPGYTEGPMPVF